MIMARLWLYLNQHASLEENKEMIRRVCNKSENLENFRYLIEVYRPSFSGRQIDKRVKLERMLENLKKDNFVKFILGKMAEGYPNLIEFVAGDIYIPRVKDFRTITGTCPWTNRNFREINRIFQEVYHKGILDFPIER